MKGLIATVFCAMCLNLTVHGQQNGTQPVSFEREAAQSKIDVLVDGKPFTSFLYTDQLEKPVLYPLVAAGGHILTRGFPLEKRGSERTDHPHHVGLWFNYESVNGLDFWNNSYNIPVEKKSKYGWIRNVKVTGAEGGKSKGTLKYTANWEKQDRTALLKESTSLVFSGTADTRTIERMTTLTALKDTVFFKDVKDGMLGIRVTKELELPSDKEESYTDNNGIVTRVSPTNNGASGDYLTSEGKRGNDAWGTRGRWCILFGTKDGQPISIAIIDHSKNPGYPAYWHARDYGLFAANPLGQAVFSNGKETMNLKLSPGQSVTFRYLVVLSTGKVPNADKLNALADNFSKK